MSEMRELQFRVVEAGEWAYILWPWETPEAFLYEAHHWGAAYQLRMPIDRPDPRFWIDIVAAEGTHGEYSRDLFFGRLQWGYALYRRFNARGSHYLTQHGLDGIPAAMWTQAYECKPGVPVGRVMFQFKVETAKRGAFAMTFWDWQQHFVSGRNEHISQMAITITKSRK